MSDITIRLAEAQDLAAIIKMLADDPLGAVREQVSDPPAKAYQDAFADIQNDERNVLIVAEQNAAVIGCLQLTFIPGLSHQGAERAQIESVRVDKAARGQGLGRTLIEDAVERASERGCAMVQLTTDASRTDARRFYEGLGFAPSHIGMKRVLNDG